MEQPISLRALSCVAGQSLARPPRQVHANARTGGGARCSRSRGGSVRRAAYQQAWDPVDVDDLERMVDAEEFARAVLGPASDDFPYLTARRSPWTAEAPRAGK
ncbi:hypothetical protein CFC35_01625 [Streptomyces sp. FBKL.4005]|nr:hypothetical protein CFC35_01625 [Streptomyces sp. FBKL.4005]